MEAGALPLWEMKSPEPTELDRQIAGHVLPLIPDGAVIQLGIGGMPNALGELLAESDLKDLGMHTELCSDGYLAWWVWGRCSEPYWRFPEGLKYWLSPWWTSWESARQLGPWP